MRAYKLIVSGKRSKVCPLSYPFLNAQNMRFRSVAGGTKWGARAARLQSRGEHVLPAEEAIEPVKCMPNDLTGGWQGLSSYASFL